MLLETGWTTLLVLKAACSSEISVIYQNVRRRTSEGIYGYNSLVFQNAKIQRAKIAKFCKFYQLEHRLY